MLKDRIIELRKQGKSYNQIVAELGCSKGTVAYHLGDGQKEKTYQRTVNRRATVHPLQNKLERFLYKKHTLFDPATKLRWEKILYFKLRTFNGKSYTNMITFEQALEKFGPNPKCYLTGTPIDLSKPSTYELDHIIPKSRGGDNSIDNLGLASKQANQAKGNMTNEEFIALCKQIVKYQSCIDESNAYPKGTNQV
jgi:5-methylcytosine-specific restriction endonuclease McrA